MYYCTAQLLHTDSNRAAAKITSEEDATPANYMGETKGNMATKVARFIAHVISERDSEGWRGLGRVGRGWTGREMIYYFIRVQLSRGLSLPLPCVCMVRPVPCVDVH